MMRVVLLVALCLLPRLAWAADATITYVTSRTLYVDAGTDAGLVVGAEVEIVRAGEVIGGATVREASARRAACAWVSGEEPPVVGDVVRFDVVASPEPAADPDASWWAARGLRGRVGLQSVHLRDRSGVGQDFDRPALDLRLRGENVAGSGIGIEADVRARHTSVGDVDRSVARTYRLNASGGRRDAGWSWTAGRQFAPSIRAIHLFDGARVRYARGDWSFGALAGTQPDPEDLAPSGDLVEGGVYATLRSTAPERRWSVTTAAIASYESGTVDREFLSLQGLWSNDRVVARVDQELDLNRGWKRDAGESLLGVTSTNLIVRVRLDRRWSVNAGLDNRRRVRRIRDRETPQTEFDDAYRRGVWAGLDVRRVQDFDFGLRLQTRGGATTSSADAATFTAGYRPRWIRGARLGSRTTVYRNELVEGWLQSVRVHARATPRVDVGVFGGIRHEAGRSNDLMDGDDPWFGADVDVDLARDLWLSGSWERTFDGEEAFEQFWFGSGLRF